MCLIKIKVLFLCANFENTKHIMIWTFIIIKELINVLSIIMFWLKSTFIVKYCGLHVPSWLLRWLLRLIHFYTVWLSNHIFRGFMKYYYILYYIIFYCMAVYGLLDILHTENIKIFYFKKIIQKVWKFFNYFLYWVIPNILIFSFFLDQSVNWKYSVPISLMADWIINCVCNHFLIEFTSQ